MFVSSKARARSIARALVLIALAGAMATAGHAGEGKTYDTSRIVSVGGDVTEILYELGLGDNVVAVDTTSVFPQPGVSQKKSVGYMRALSSEGVLSIGPTLILATDKSGPPEVVAALKASSAPFVTVEAPDTPEGVAQKVHQVAKLVGKEAAGEALAARIRKDFEAAAQTRAQITKPVKALFLLSVQSGRALAGGRNTAADAMLGLAGAENIMSGFEGYKPLSGEAALTLAPDVIVVMQRGGGHRTADASGSVAAEIAAIEGLAATPAAKNGRIVEFDGSLMLQFGPRAPKAARELMQIFYPETANARRIN
ncbi:hemin ABC transporter substrate-binding protein [Hyphomicrobium sp.]|uniref:heme/hemin ABC transporter substrate-binding protein n=1 Tax=Hyphomicrobium sp. TaxID=82 RepID=UPI0025BA1C42|nr:hemin ABC transporter substrate-binding protein [Hyphomicrobium sp.]MCC7252431.1 hemin ABC transporter substrate-binding protein [Hyphomicrobium sp.]